MPKEIVIAIILAIIQIPIGIIGGTMPEERSKVPPISSAVSIVLILILLGLYWGERISQNWVLYGTIALSIAVVGILIFYVLRAKRRRIIKKESDYDHNVYVAKTIADDKSESLLNLTDALQDLGDLAIELANNLAKSGIAEAKLKTIQRRLQEDYKIKQLGMYEDVPEQTIRNGVKQTLKRLRISGVNRQTIMFMLHVAGVLDDEGVGVMTQWQESDKHKLVAKLQPKVATQELNNAIYVYLCYCIGINSILLLVSYFPGKAIRKVNRTFKKTPAELREDRTRILNTLLTDIRQLAENEL